MRVLSPITATLLFATSPAMAQSQWLNSGSLNSSEVSALCELATDVRLLARDQMIAIGNERWRRLSRQELVVEAFVMGGTPLDPGRCYVLARAGFAGDTERQLFEVRDFVVSAESTTVFVIGRGSYLPPSSADASR
jgi:hypothetical protein